MIVLSLFDGMSCGQIALERVGLKVDTYFASEIKRAAIEVTKYNYPNTIHIGDVSKVYYKDGILFTENGNFETEIDMVIGGSPCQDFSVAMLVNKVRHGLEGEKSSLFYEYLRILREIEPKFFLLENVKMNADSEMQLNDYLGINGLHINASLVSYQNRPRIYWTNIPNVTIPQDRKINFQVYKNSDPIYCAMFKCPRNAYTEKMWKNGEGKNNKDSCTNITHSTKINTLTRKQYRNPNSGLIQFDDFCRFLTREEIEKAQTLPSGYTTPLSYNQMQDVCGDGWCVDVIAHIFSFIDGEKIAMQPKHKISSLEQISIFDLE